MRIYKMLVNSRDYNNYYSCNYKIGPKVASLISFIIFMTYSDIGLLLSKGIPYVIATSINYGISQQPITDINQLMPKLCQNQTIICEGSFCIPNVKRCVCDLRMPVQIGRFCLRQIDIETKCFSTNQCNHTVRDAVCVDINSNSVLDPDSSKFKLEQWHQLSELKKLSQSTLTKEAPTKRYQSSTGNNVRDNSRNPMFLIGNRLEEIKVVSSESVILSNARNSPYEINYSTPELLHQNHTRRRTNSNSNRAFFNSLPGKESSPATTIPSENSISVTPMISSEPTMLNSDSSSSSSSDTTRTTTTTTTTTTATTSFTNSATTAISTTNSKPEETIKEDIPTTTVTYSDVVNRKKTTIKTPHWPPGLCSCPNGYMFDSMLRKCLALSLADSHCQNDHDCKQILSSHCSKEAKKCECDEPFVWDQKVLACTRPKQPVKSENPINVVDDKEENNSFISSFIYNINPVIILKKLFPGYSVIVVIFILFFISGSLCLILECCFSSNKSALISPKSKKKKLPQNNLPPRSPYATLRRPDTYKPSSQLSNFTQVTRGRILNYDFEQEGPGPDDGGGSSPQPMLSKSATLRPGKVNGGHKHNEGDRSATLRSKPRSNKNHKRDDRATSDAQISNQVEADDLPSELNDNISLSQLDSEGKSESGALVIPAPPPNQQPPYMLKNPMRGQSSAIAAAAAAVANKRLQMAQKRNLDSQQQSNGKVNSESPVFL